MFVLGQWLLLVLYGLLAVANVARGILEFVVIPAFASRPLALPLPLLGAVYLIWGAAFMVAGLVFFRRASPRTRLFVRVTAIVYQVTVWIIHLVGDVAAYARALWLRDAVLSALFLIVVFLVTLSPARRTSTQGRG